MSRLSLLTFSLFSLLTTLTACDGCGETLNAIPAPQIELAFEDDVTPPLERIEVALPPPALNTTARAELMVRNVGTAPLNLESLRFESDDACPQPSGAFVLASAPQSVAPDGEDTIVVEFTPQSAALVCATLVVSSNDENNAEVRATLRGQGDAARLCADRALIDFGSVFIGDSVVDVVELTSCGTRPITLSNFNTNDQFPPFGVELPQTTTLDPEESLTLNLSFTPTEVRTHSIAAQTQGTIFIDSDAFGQQYQIDLIASSRLPPACRLQTVPQAINFGQIAEGRSSTQALVIRNIGELECNLSDISLQTPNTSFSLAAQTLPALLAPTELISVDVTFAPQNASGTENNVIEIASNDAVAPLISVPVEANSIEPTPCLLEATPSGVNFGNQPVGVNKSIAITLTNVGSANCSLQSADLILGEPHFSATVSTLPLIGLVIPDGDSTEVIVNYKPLDEGSHVGTLRLRHQELRLLAPQQDLLVPLSGSATSPRICVVPGSIDFGDVSVGDDAVQSVEVQNCGTTELLFRGLGMRGGSHPDFRFDPVALPMALQPGQVQRVQVHAAPQALGPMYGALSVFSNDNNAPTTTVPLSANAGACAGLVCTPSDIDFGETLVGAYNVRAVTCANQSSQTVTPAPVVSGDFTLVSSPATIAPLGTGTFVVSFQGANPISATGTLNVGVADCDGNPLSVPLSASAVIDEVPPCPTPQAFTPDVVWHWEGSGALPNSNMTWTTPLISRLEDTTGDQKITRDDMPRVVFISFDGADTPPPDDFDRVNDPVPGHLRALDGATGAEIFTNTDVQLSSGVTPALADIDADGFVEIIAQKWVLIPGVADIPGGPKVKGKFVRGSLIAFEHDGTFKWESAEWSRSQDELEDSGAISVADIDGDGLAEIAVGDHVYNHDGSIRFIGGKGTGSTGHGPISVFVDLDGSPGLELLAGRTAYRNNGTVLWDRDDLGDALGPFITHSVAADLNNDGRNEVIFRGKDLMVVDGATGNTIAGPLTPPTLSSHGAECDPNDNGGDEENENPCNIIPTHVVVLNIDGGNDLEIGVAAEENFLAYKVVGNGFQELWRASIGDFTGASGPIGFDFESDGQQNIVYNDQGSLFVYSPSGQTIYDASRSSVTLAETSAVGDINNDGSANLVIGSNDPLLEVAEGLDMLSNSGVNWAHARGIWNQHAYVESLIGEMGTLIPDSGGPLDGFRTATAVCVD